MRMIRSIAALAATAVLAAGCSGDDEPAGAPPAAVPPPVAPEVVLASSLQPVDSCDDLGTWMTDELAPRVGAYGLGGDVIVLEREAATTEDAAGSSDGAAEMAPEPPAASTSGDSDATRSQAAEAATEFSETNVQVEGVDEPDVVKTDGDRILAVAEGRLHLASASDGRLVSSVELPEGMHDAEMLLAGDRVLVLAQSGFFATATDAATDDVDRPVADVGREIMPPDAGTVGTRVAQVDISGDTLDVTDSFVLDGDYVSARMTGDAARLVLQADPQRALPFVAPASPTPEAEEAALQHNQELVEQAAPEDLLPRWRQLGEDGEETDDGPLMSCEDVHAPTTFAGLGMVTVVSIDVSEGLAGGLASADAAGVLATGQTVYASAEHLYVAAPEWVDWQAGPEEGDRSVPAEQGTDIHRFDITDPTRATYEMSGHVDGTLLDQFAMDEHDGHLRVATTTGSPWMEGAGESESGVVVLAPGDGALAPVGEVTGLGRGETIHSVRFMGDVGYVVTFEQTDPLYTIDLSDPTSPAVTGELEILGYSAYLHPVGDGRLIGVGQDATEDGGLLGTQVALFDVSDPAAPTRVAQATLANATSTAEWDHRAFLWWAEDGLVAVPLSSYESTPFEGLVGFSVDVDGGTVSERGRITHPPVPGGVGGPVPLPEPMPIEPGDGPAIAPGEPVPTDTFPYSPMITRSLVVGDRLWTLSTAGLGSTALAMTGDTTFLPFG